jgi:hypothetical protein
MMSRTSVLFGSAVALRVMDGLAAVESLWFDPVTAWT